MKDGVCLGWEDTDHAVRDDWDPVPWHRMRIEKRGTEFKVFVDDLHLATRWADLGGGHIGYIVEDCKSLVRLYCVLKLLVDTLFG